MTALPCTGPTLESLRVSACLSLRPNHRSGSRRTSTQNPLPEPRVGFEPARAYPAHAAPSRFSNPLGLLNHVARLSYQPDELRYVSGSRPSIVSTSSRFRGPLAISGDRNKKHPLVAHNGNFDGPFLAAWYRRLGMFMPATHRVFCTMQRALWLFHEDRSLTPPDDYKLLTLCQYFGVPLVASDAHDALNDVRATLALYREFSRQAAPSGHTGTIAQSEGDLRLLDGLEDLRHGRTLSVDEALSRLRLDDDNADESIMHGARLTTTAMATFENQFHQVKLDAAESAEVWLDYRQQAIEKLIVESEQLPHATEGTEGHEIRELRLAGSQIRFLFTITDQGVVILCIASSPSAVNNLPITDTLPY